MSERLAIQNLGYLWDRNRIYWGVQGPGQTGTLLGAHKSYCMPIDFRDQKGIYVLHTEKLEIIYIGQVGSGTDGLFDRLKRHRDAIDKWNRWRYFSWFGTRRVNSTSCRLAEHSEGSPNIKGPLPKFLDQLEAILMQCVEPKLNKRGPDWAGAEQFEQIDDEKLETSDLPAIAGKQAEIIEMLESLLSRKG